MTFPGQCNYDADVGQSPAFFNDGVARRRRLSSGAVGSVSQATQRGRIPVFSQGIVLRIYGIADAGITGRPVARCCAVGITKTRESPAMSTMNSTKIEWANNTWNVFSGCTKISPGCQNCYASQLAERLRGTRAFPNGFDLTVRPHKLIEPYKLKQPSLVFVNSMSDLFWDAVPNELRDQIVDVMESTPQHEYMVLTKRAEAMLAYSRRRRLPPNFWAGVSIENERYAHRADLLRQVDAEVRFISAEPLLGPLDLDLTGIHWVIVVVSPGGTCTTRPSVEGGRSYARRVSVGCRERTGCNGFETCVIPAKALVSLFFSNSGAVPLQKPAAMNWMGVPGCNIPGCLVATTAAGTCLRRQKLNSSRYPVTFSDHS